MKKLLQFKAVWCAPCRAISPFIQEFKDQYDISVIDIDTDDGMAAGARFKVKKLPTVVILDESDNEVKRLVGAEQITREALA